MIEVTALVIMEVLLAGEEFVLLGSTTESLPTE